MLVDEALNRICDFQFASSRRLDTSNGVMNDVVKEINATRGDLRGDLGFFSNTRPCSSFGNAKGAGCNWTQED